MIASAVRALRGPGAGLGEGRVHRGEERARVRRELALDDRAAGRPRRRALREDLGCTHLRYGECMRHFFTRTT